MKARAAAIAIQRPCTPPPAGSVTTAIIPKMMTAVKRTISYREWLKGWAKIER
jgi:hypothetical protein